MNYPRITKQGDMFYIQHREGEIPARCVVKLTPTNIEVGCTSISSDAAEAIMTAWKIAFKDKPAIVEL
jgi:hypothetical protein